MYIQENPVEQPRTAPPDYSGHTYVPEPTTSPIPPEEKTCEDVSAADVAEQEDARMQKSTPVGAFSGGDNARFSSKEGKRGDFFGGIGLNSLFSRIPFLSSLAPPPRTCGGDRKHSELWDFVLLAVIALSLLNGKDDDVLPLLLLLLLWD